MKSLRNVFRFPLSWTGARARAARRGQAAADATTVAGGPRASTVLRDHRRAAPVPARVVARTDAVADIAASEARFRSLTLLGSDWHWDQDPYGRLTAISGNLADPIGALLDAHRGRPLWEIPALAPLQGGWSPLRRALKARETFRDVVLRAPRPDGGYSFVSISGEPVFGADGMFAGYRGVGLDITRQKLIEANVSRLARFDPLTGLHNRTAFFERLEHALARAGRNQRHLALLFVDLDRFKDVNDAFGHLAGDEVLKALTLRLSRTVRSADTIARLGGDEFIVLAEDVANNVDVNELGLRVLQALSEPVVLDGQECRLGASIGVGMYPEDGEDTTTLLKNADAAMYRAKEAGGNTLAFAAEVQDRPATERMVFRAALRSALDLDQLRLLYQPKVSIRTGELTGVEALVRWQHPEHGLILPDAFIPLAEESGLIRQIARWVLHQACTQGCRWQHEFRRPVRVAVNLSARQFVDGGLVIEVAHALAQSGLTADLLELEITESMMMAQPERAAETLREIREMGVHLSIDDFGTGYSSLARLKKFPIGSVKIDRSFIGDITTDADDAAIVSAVIAMAHNLRMRVVAEGVETLEQVRFLHERGCDEIQGFLVSRPLAPDDVVEFASRTQAARAAVVEGG